MIRTSGILHDLSFALMAGGIAGIGLAAGSIFGKAPTREIAGQIGNDLFARLGPAILILSFLALATRLVLHRSEPPSGWRTTAMVLAVVTAALAVAVALWLTPVMNSIWHGTSHAIDGSGLVSDERKRFLMLHGISNLFYMGIMLLSASELALRAFRRI